MMETLQWLYESHRPYSPYVVAGGAVVVTALVAHNIFSRVRKSSVLLTAPPDTAVIYQLKRGPNAPSLSPFPLKLETYCRLAKIPYLVTAKGGRSSNKKIPWMTYNGEVVNDSQFCIDYFNNKLGIDLNSHLNNEEKAVARFIQVTADEHLYWTLVHFRWVLTSPASVLRHLGWSPLMAPMVRKVVSKQTYAQGIGRHSPEQIKAIMVDDLKCLSGFLGTKPFMLGDKICEADCSVFGMLAQLVWHPPEGFEDLVKGKFPNLHQYCFRIKDKVWPDWDECCKNLKR